MPNLKCSEWNPAQIISHLLYIHFLKRFQIDGKRFGRRHKIRIGQIGDKPPTRSFSREELCVISQSGSEEDPRLFSWMEVLRSAELYVLFLRSLYRSR